MFFSFWLTSVRTTGSMFFHITPNDSTSFLLVTNIPLYICTMCTHAKSLQSCLTLCDPMDCGWWGSSIHGILSRQQYWSGLPSSPPGDLPNPETEPSSLISPALACGFFTFSTILEACIYISHHLYLFIFYWTFRLFPFSWCCSVPKLCPTLCDPRNWTMPGFSVLHYLL